MFAGIKRMFSSVKSWFKGLFSGVRVGRATKPDPVVPVETPVPHEDDITGL
jgi:hypothetical protein